MKLWFSRASEEGAAPCERSVSCGFLVPRCQIAHPMWSSPWQISSIWNLTFSPMDLETSNHRTSNPPRQAHQVGSHSSR